MFTKLNPLIHTKQSASFVQVSQINDWTLVALFCIGVPINILSLWLLLQKMFNFGAGRRGERGSITNNGSRKLKSWSGKSTSSSDEAQGFING